MATIAEDHTVRKGAAKAPISTHPAFPAIVALWFAALLGLGSLVLPIVLLEKLVTVTGIAALVPAAEPPLGFTARAAIALIGAIVGAVIGLLLARQIARSHIPQPRARSFVGGEARECRPISAHDELGEEGLGSPAPEPTAHKRRSLAIAEDSAPSRYLQSVPLPGQTHQDDPDLEALLHAPEGEPAEDDGNADESERQEFVPQSEAAADDALELGDFAEDAAGMTEAEVPGGLEALRRRVRPAENELSMQDQTMTEGQNFQPPAGFAEHDGERQEFRSFDAPAEAAGEEPEHAPPPVPQAFEPVPDAADPLPFAAPSLQRSLAAEADEVEQTEQVEQAEADFAAAPAPMLSVVETPESGAATEFPADDRPLEELGLVQLAARLGASIERRRKLKARPAVAPVVAPASDPFGPTVGAPEEFEAAEAEDAARAIADFFGPGEAAAPGTATHGVPEPEPEPEPARPTVPASLRSLPIAEDDDEEDALSASFSLPLRARMDDHAQPAGESTDEGDSQGGDELEDEDEYSSLLAMKNPFSRHEEFVRVEEPDDDGGDIEPTVTFPATAPAPAAEPPAAIPARHDSASSARPFDPPGKSADSAARASAAGTPRDSGEAERDLRAALATLQRMSGAA